MNHITDHQRKQLNEKEWNRNHKYFQEALSDFMYDAASGRAIRHLCDSGYTAAQIAHQLNYPTSFAKIRQTITRRLKETGILMDELPASCKNIQTVTLKQMTPEKLFSFLAEHVRQNGEEHCFVACPFGTGVPWTDANRQKYSMLTMREYEYLESIVWDAKIMYHMLNRRMLEISVQIAAYSETVRFYFLKNRQCYESRPYAKP